MLLLLLKLLLLLVVYGTYIVELGMRTLKLSIALGLLLEGKIKYCFGILELLARLIVTGPAYIECRDLASSASLEEHLIETQLIRLHGNVFEP